MAARPGPRRRARHGAGRVCVVRRRASGGACEARAGFARCANPSLAEPCDRTGRVRSRRGARRAIGVPRQDRRAPGSPRRRDARDDLETRMPGAPGRPADPPLQLLGVRRRGAARPDGRERRGRRRRALGVRAAVRRRVPHQTGRARDRVPPGSVRAASADHQPSERDRVVQLPSGGDPARPGRRLLPACVRPRGRRQPAPEPVRDHRRLRPQSSGRAVHGPEPDPRGDDPRGRRRRPTRSPRSAGNGAGTGAATRTTCTSRCSAAEQEVARAEASAIAARVRSHRWNRLPDTIRT